MQRGDHRGRVEIVHVRDDRELGPPQRGQPEEGVEREVADRNGLGGPRRATQSTPMVTFGIKR